MTEYRTEPYGETGGGMLRVRRSRGALSGLLLVLLGAWGALVAFIGPSFNFAYTPDSTWTWTSARGWLEVLPGVVVAVGGLLLLISTNRVVAIAGAWLAIAGGAWFIIGPQLAPVLHVGAVGTPTGSSNGMRALESLAYFYALGAVVLFLASAAFGRLTVRSAGDLRAAHRRQPVPDTVAAPAPPAAAPVAAPAPPAAAPAPPAAAPAPRAADATVEQPGGRASAQA